MIMPVLAVYVTSLAVLAILYAHFGRRAQAEARRLLTASQAALDEAQKLHAEVMAAVSRRRP